MKILEMLKRLLKRPEGGVPWVDDIPYETRANYTVCAAMRGPDLNNLDGHKWVFTARIRYFAGYSSSNAPCDVRETHINRPTADLLRVEIEAHRGRFFGTGYGHYINHTMWALERIHSWSSDPDFSKEAGRLWKIASAIARGADTYTLIERYCQLPPAKAGGLSKNSAAIGE